MLQTIINAIRNREVLLFTYSGFDRTVQPAAAGESRADNTFQVSRPDTSVVIKGCPPSMLSFSIAAVTCAKKFWASSVI